MTRAKKVVKIKNQFFSCPSTTQKNFWNPFTPVLWFYYLFSRASNGRQYSMSWNFQLKISLCSVFQYTEWRFFRTFNFDGQYLLIQWEFRDSIYILGLLNFWQPDLALIYVIVLSSGSPKIPISVFYHLLLTHFFSLEALQLAGLSARALGPASWRASRLKKPYLWMLNFDQTNFKLLICT